MSEPDRLLVFDRLIAAEALHRWIPLLFPDRPFCTHG